MSKLSDPPGIMSHDKVLAFDVRLAAERFVELVNKAREAGLHVTIDLTDHDDGRIEFQTWIDRPL